MWVRGEHEKEVERSITIHNREGGQRNDDGFADPFLIG